MNGRPNATAKNLRLLPALSHQQGPALTFLDGDLYHPLCPAWVYVKGLAQGDSQRTITSALRTLVHIIFPDYQLSEDSIYRYIGVFTDELYST